MDSVTPLLSFVVVCCYLHLTAAFIPVPPMDFAMREIRPVEFTRPPSITHWAMTEEAVLQVTAELFQDHPNTDFRFNSTNQIHLLLTDSVKVSTAKLITAYYCNMKEARGNAGGCSLAPYQVNHILFLYNSVIDTIKHANAEVDLGSVGVIAAAHFDSEQFKDGQKRLVTLRKLAVESIKTSSYLPARLYVGQLLHTLQDFYSHSNWIEMGNSAPYSVLGDPELEIPSETIAPQEMTMCNDCTTAEEIPEGPRRAAFFYDCDSSTNIMESVNRKFLTSGYYAGQLDSSGNEIIKPKGKCSHGGHRDPSSDMPATGGINKDSEAFSWSPHADLHAVAARIATESSVQILRSIRNDVANDSKFAAFLNIDIPDSDPVSVISITYVVDTTAGMKNEVLQIKAAITRVKERIATFEQSEVFRFILVAFSDQDPANVFVTWDINEFSHAIGEVNITGSGDCQRPYVGALIQAVQASNPGSPIFLFTNASPSDASQVPVLEALVAVKRVRIYPILTPGSDKCKANHNNAKKHHPAIPTGRNDDLKIDLITAITGGQVFRTPPSEIKEILTPVTLSAIIATDIIFYVANLTSPPTYTFPVDEKVSEVTISVNGATITPTVKTPEGDVYEIKPSLQPSTTYIATIGSSHLYGKWELNVSSFGPHSVQISAATDFSFAYTLYQFDPTSSFGFVSVSSKPIAGKPTFLTVSTQGNTEGMMLTQAMLLEFDGKIVQIMNLTSTGSDTFATDKFLYPAVAFRLQVIGVDSNRNRVSRINAIGLHPSDVELKLGDEFVTVDLLPGHSESITMLLTNFGKTATFSLQATPADHNSCNDSVSYSVQPQQVLVKTNETVETVATVSLRRDASECGGPATLLTVTASGVNEDRSDFIMFMVSHVDPSSQASVEGWNAILLTILIAVCYIAVFYYGSRWL